MLLFYAVYRKDPVIITGQAFGVVVYLRNLILISRKRSTIQQEQEAPATVNMAYDDAANSPTLRKAG